MQASARSALPESGGAAPRARTTPLRFTYRTPGRVTPPWPLRGAVEKGPCDPARLDDRGALALRIVGSVLVRNEDVFVKRADPQCCVRLRSDPRPQPVGGSDAGDPSRALSRVRPSRRGAICQRGGVTSSAAAVRRHRHLGARSGRRRTVRPGRARPSASTELLLRLRPSWPSRAKGTSEGPGRADLEAGGCRTRRCPVR